MSPPIQLLRSLRQGCPFQKIRKATGPTINLEKTKVLPIKTNQMSHIKQNITEVTILEQHQYIKKILGIQISENLQETITLNWQNNLKKRKIYTKNVH